MLGNLDPGKIQQMMDKMGMDTETVEATEVVFHTKGGKLVVKDPEVTKIDMQGQEIFQVQGEAVETSGSSEEEEETEVEFDEEDVETVVQQTGVSEEEAKEALEREGDLARAIMKLS